MEHKNLYQTIAVNLLNLICLIYLMYADYNVNGCLLPSMLDLFRHTDLNVCVGLVNYQTVEMNSIEYSIRVQYNRHKHWDL